MFQPARLKRAIVASCKLPLGMPSLSLLATRFLFLAGALIRCFPIRGFKWQRFGEATDRAFVADKAIALDLYPKQKGVVVAIGSSGDYAQAVAAGFALHPQLLAGATPESHEAGLQRLGIADGVQKTEHQYFACARVLYDAGRQAIHFVEVNHLLS